MDNINASITADKNNDHGTKDKDMGLSLTEHQHFLHSNTYM